MIRIDKNSHETILFAWLGGALVLTPLWLLVHNLWITVPITVLAVVFMCFVTWFFRVPKRQAPAGERLVTSVCDGKVVIVEKAFEKEYLKRECIQVSVYMNFFCHRTSLLRLWTAPRCRPLPYRTMASL